MICIVQKIGTNLIIDNYDVCIQEFDTDKKFKHQGNRSYEFRQQSGRYKRKEKGFSCKSAVLEKYPDAVCQIENNRFKVVSNKIVLSDCATGKSVWFHALKFIENGQESIAL